MSYVQNKRILFIECIFVMFVEANIDWIFKNRNNQNWILLPPTLNLISHIKLKKRVVKTHKLNINYF